MVNDISQISSYIYKKHTYNCIANMHKEITYLSSVIKSLVQNVPSHHHGVPYF